MPLLYLGIIDLNSCLYLAQFIILVYVTQNIAYYIGQKWLLGNEVA